MVKNAQGMTRRRHARPPRTRVVSLLLALLVSGLATGCLSMLFKPADTKARHYDRESPPAPWQATASGISDEAFQFPADKSMLSVNSVCGQYQDLSLEELSKNALSGIE